MSKRKKRRTRAANEDAASQEAASDPALSKEPALSNKEVSKVTASAPKPDVNMPRRNGLALLITAGSLWFGWFLFLVYVALTRS